MRITLLQFVINYSSIVLYTDMALEIKKGLSIKASQIREEDLYDIDNPDFQPMVRLCT